MNTTRTLLAATLLLALACLTACGSDSDAGSAGDAAAGTSTPSASGGTAESGSLSLTADGGTAGKCAMPSAETLATFDTAFSGTVTDLDGGTATLEVDEWYAGDEAPTVTVESPSNELRDLLMAVDFQEGRTYLVSATDSRVSLCGYTGEPTPELEAMYAEAFGG